MCLVLYLVRGKRALGEVIMIEPKTLNAEEKIFEKKKNLFDNISDGKVIFYPLIQAVTFVLLYDFMRCNKLFCFLFVPFFISFYGITKRNGNQKHIIF